MPTEILYAIITFLGICVVTLGGLWIKDIMTHRQWAVEQITEVTTKVAVLEKTHDEIKENLKEMKEMIKHHTQLEEEFQRLIIARLNIHKE